MRLGGRRDTRVDGSAAVRPWLVAAAVAAVATEGVAVFVPAERWCARDNASGTHEWLRDINRDIVVPKFTKVVLRCCPRDFSAIEWFRVDPASGARVKMPDLANSSFEVYEDGQTLFTDEAQERDTGWYECVVHRQHNTSVSDKEVIKRSFQIRIQNAPSSNENKLLQPTFEIITQRVGDKFELRCSVIGDTPVSWYQVHSNGKSVFPNRNLDFTIRKNVKIQATNSDESKSGHANITKITGQEIIFNPLQRENFGNYTCRQNKTSIRNVTLIEGGYDEELTITVIFLSIIFVLLIVTIPTGWFWRWEILLLWKDRFGRLEENDDKDYDVFVSYDTQDAQFVLGILVPVLEDLFHYRCFAWERDSLAGEWIPETLVQSIRVSRRFLMVLSPALLENRWCVFALHIALKAVLQLQLHIICVKLQDIDWPALQMTDKSASDTIRQVLRVVRTVEWKTKEKPLIQVHKEELLKDDNIFNFDKLLRKSSDFPDDSRAPGRSQFWKKLRLYLPPRRSLPLLIKQPESPTSTKSLLSLPRGSDYC